MITEIMNIKYDTNKIIPSILLIFQSFFKNHKKSSTMLTIAGARNRSVYEDTASGEISPET
ncbi:MAG: hypothetical protein AABY40_00025, partial [Nanoarchaeota archaeon]